MKNVISEIYLLRARWHFFITLEKIGLLPAIWSVVSLVIILFWCVNILPEKRRITAEIKTIEPIIKASTVELSPVEHEKKQLNMTESHLLKELFLIFESHKLKITNSQYRFADESISKNGPEIYSLILDMPIQGTYPDFYHALISAMQLLPTRVEKIDIRREGYEKDNLHITLSLRITLEEQGRGT